MSTTGRSREHRGFWQVFFLLLGINSFTITETFLLFFKQVGAPSEHVLPAALITLSNVLFITALGAAACRLYIRRQVDRPLQRMQADLDAIAAGDFSVRLQPPRGNSVLAEVAHSINQMAEELAQVETLKTGFISDVSHELKTPLATMSNYSRLLMEPGISEQQQREYAQAIADASERLAAMVSNILRLNRLENQSATLVIDEYDLADQLAECLLGFEEVWEERGIEVEPDLADDVRVRCDRELMTVVWNNLLSNAFKFTPSGGTVSVTLESEGDEAIVCVRDTGCGMSEDERRHVFDKFYQGDTSHATEGNGLGLAMVRRIIDMSGATISVASAPGEGSTFMVRLPLAAAAEA